MKPLLNINAILCFFALIYTNCSLLPKTQIFSANKSYTIKSQNYDLEKDTVNDLRRDFNSGNYEKVKEKSEEFKTKFPNSTFSNEVLYLYALSLESSEDWDEALDNYKKIIDLSLEGNKEFVALALYRKANCYEAKREPEIALASLFDALNYKAYLPIEVSLAEIPARMSSIYAGLNQTTQADYYAIIAEKGISKARQLKKNNEQEWLGYTLLQMGSISLGTLTAENFYENLLSFSRHQKYLLQAIELKNPAWSIKAEELLIRNYTNFWTSIINYNINPSSDWEMDFVLKLEKQVEMASQLLESLGILKTYQIPEESATASSTSQVFSKLQIIEDNATTLVQKQTLLKPSQKFKSQILSGNIKTTEFEDAVPEEIEQKFPPKNTKKPTLNIKKEYKKK